MIDAPALPIAAAEGGGVFVVWVVLAIFWGIGKLKEAAEQGKRRQAEERRLRELAAGAPPRTEIPTHVPGRSTQDEGEELERWLRETLGMPGELPPTPRPVPAPLPREEPASRRAPRAGSTGPLGRRADVPLENAEEVEERASLEVEGDRTDYDEAFPTRGEVEIVDLDLESVRAAEARRRATVGRERAHAKADHDAFHDRIADSAGHDARVADAGRRRRAALVKAFVASEVFGRPVGERPPT